MGILPFSVVLMVSALACYTLAVWSVRFAGRLKPWHLGFFWLGLAFDGFGTFLMSRMAGGFVLNLHGLTGLVAILLMLGQTLWGTLALWRQDEAALTSFYRFSLVIWLIWLIAFISGMIMGMSH